MIALSVETAQETKSFSDPEHIGAVLIPDFFDRGEVGRMNAELSNPSLVEWQDAHEVYKNARNMTIVQNHFSYALKLSRGDQSYFNRLRAIKDGAQKIGSFIRSLSPMYPALSSWEADEISIHRYDAEHGLSRHKDNARFIGVIAIATLEGDCDLVITKNEKLTALTPEPGDLVLLRAPGLTDIEEDLRPEHAVLNLRTPTRTSMMVRANNRPDDIIQGFKFVNWP